MALGAVIRFLAVVALLAVAVAFFALSRPDAVPKDVAVEADLPDGPVTIVVFGTSLSAPPQTWPDGVAESLSRCLARPVSVERLVGMGQGSAWAVTQIAQVADLAPDIVLIEFAVNDADLLDGVSLARAAMQHRTLISGLREAVPSSVVVLMTMSPVEGPRGWIRPRLASHYAQYHAFAAESDVGLIDLYPRWLALNPGARGLEHDGLHPDPRVAADVIVPNVVQYLLASQKCQ